jgi:hypothetical protein
MTQAYKITVKDAAINLSITGGVILIAVAFWGAVFYPIYG